MTRSPWIALAVLVGVAPVPAAEPPDLRRLFPEQADVLVSLPGGLVRLDLPLAVLAACRPDLSDLRVLAPDGSEVPFVVDGGFGARAQSIVRETVEAALLDVRRDETKRDDAPAEYRERYTVAAPAEAATGGAWELVVTTTAPTFVRRVAVTAERPDGSTATLVEDGALFRLQSPLRERLRLAVPGAEGTRLTITLTGSGDGYLAPAFRFESSRAIDARERAAVPLEEISRKRAEGRTIVELARPGGLVPDVLRIETTTPYFERPVEVWDEGPANQDVRIGGADLFRIETPVRVEEREVVIRPSTFQRLRVEVVDRDSPSLEDLRFVAVVQQPSLVLSLRSSSATAPAATLYFGGGRAYAPRYDLGQLTTLLAGSVAGARVPAAVQLREPGGLERAELAAIRENPQFDGAPLLAFAMHPGAVLDARLWTDRRAIRVSPSTEGLSRLRLDSEDVARARPDLADLRVVDGERRQWPYLLASAGTPDWRAMRVEGPFHREVGQPSGPGRRAASAYRLILPARAVLLDEVALETDVAFFDRPFVLVTRDDDGRERTLASGRLTRHPERPHPLTIDLAPARVASLELVITDGDDAPLPLTTARARLLLPELYVAAPPGDYALLVGNPETDAPLYDLQRMRDVVLAVASTPVVAEASAPNPDYSPRARFAQGGGAARLLPQVTLWAVLIGAVGALAVLTLRLARRDEPDTKGPA